MIEATNQRCSRTRNLGEGELEKIESVLNGSSCVVQDLLGLPYPYQTDLKPVVDDDWLRKTTLARDRVDGYFHLMRSKEDDHRHRHHRARPGSKGEGKMTRCIEAGWKMISWRGYEARRKTL